jgi:hypothetical protein
MATTASGLTIPGSSPTTTAATPIQDHWNNLGKSLNGRVIVPVASITARAALVTALTAEGYTISASNPLYTHRADATVGSELEVTVNGTSWRTVPPIGPWTAVTFQNSWVDYGAGYQPVQYRGEGDIARVRGLMKAGTIGGVPAFTLPVGLRPPAILYGVSARTSAGAAIIVSVGVTGDVDVELGSNVLVALDFSFSVTA